MASISFDSQSPGAQRLARNWLPHLERWEVRIRPGHIFVEPAGSVVEAGQTMEVAAPQGRQLVERGSADFLSTRRITTRD